MTIPWKMHPDASGGVPTAPPPPTPDPWEHNHAQGTVTIPNPKPAERWYVYWEGGSYADESGFDSFDTKEQALQFINETHEEYDGSGVEVEFTLVRGIAVELKKAGYVLA